MAQDVRPSALVVQDASPPGGLMKVGSVVVTAVVSVGPAVPRVVSVLRVVRGLGGGVEVATTVAATAVVAGTAEVDGAEVGADVVVASLALPSAPQAVAAKRLASAAAEAMASRRRRRCPWRLQPRAVSASPVVRSSAMA